MDGGKSRHLLIPKIRRANVSVLWRLNRIIVLKENGKRQQVFFGQLILEISPGNATFICLYVDVALGKPSRTCKTTPTFSDPCFVVC